MGKIISFLTWTSGIVALFIFLPSDPRAGELGARNAQDAAKTAAVSPLAGAGPLRRSPLVSNPFLQGTGPLFDASPEQALAPSPEQSPIEIAPAAGGINWIRAPDSTPGASPVAPATLIMFHMRRS